MNRPVPSSGPTVAPRGRVARAIALASTTALALTLATPRSADALTIVPHYGTGAAAFSAAQVAVINSAINFYQTTFSDPITVDIGFWNMTCAGCLGQSATAQASGSFVGAGLYGALTADATSADDATALASLALNPIGNPIMTVASANLRALGYGIGGATGFTTSICDVTGVGTFAMDSCIGVKGSITTTSPPAAGLYSFLSVIEHEMDEALGHGSGLRGLTSTLGNMHLLDLFRYSAPGVRSYARVACTAAEPYGPLAYFSIDDGATDLAHFDNCNNGGDYGDYAAGSIAMVQDAFGTPGADAFLTSGDPAVRALDVIGYTRTVPEPASLGLLATGFLGLGLVARRRKNAAR